MSCEKNTDRLFLNYWNKIFNHIYKTNNNKKLFNTYIPDGYDIINNNLFIIENKKEYKDKINAKKQLIKYYNNVILKEDNNFNKIYLIYGYGDNESNFNYEIYIINEENKLVKIKKTLENIKDEMNINNDFDEKEIHKFNQYLYDKIQDLIKSQKTLFVASILLILDIDPNFIKDYDINKPGFIIADKMLELIQKKYNDELFTNQFNFLKKSLNNKYLFDLINKITLNVKKYGRDILNKFYNEFCKYDKNDDTKSGVVLTPHDIIELMIKELEIKRDDVVLDFCTGTGSFLLEAGKYTKNLIGCECNCERYTLSKCNFILNDLDFSKLYYNSCFNQNFPKVDKSIINPPFNCNINDEDIEENITNWKNYNKEQRFLLYQIQCLKINGLGACIIPRGNFNNSLDKSNNFKYELLKHIQVLKIINCNNKVFYPIAGPECSIIIYKRIESLKDPKISKNVKIIDYTNDGFNVNKNLRIKIKEPEIKEQIRDLNYNDDWNYNIKIDIPNNINELIAKYNLYYTLYYNTILIHNNNYNNQYYKVINNNKIIKWEKLKIGDYFEISKPKKTFKINNSIEGKYPLITRGIINNGLNKFINDYSFDGEYITIAPSGSVGACFYHSGKFAVDGPIKTFKSKNNNKINLHIWAMMINYYLTKKYSYNNGLTIEKILNEEIYIPFFE